ncbi:hypothetical protein COCSADRAFT_224976 [Bipolaris sorokiniana ND90Pr]|uniref:Uncharacterized protein n=1 Tax=Cochliobolus sativus (strain ND90Pr / ATCC 201652) TaxID=665912 RepID=M2SY24_COCSN|nr:uncharacterized protein COCSADRAFT_224976 [Bipolaris sorokiniana ND90Pr]EMD61851.1 hypothetical protein COCSADRAFT_224976 [Bipolaris sorokiniana ND90Pr]
MLATTHQGSVCLTLSTFSSLFLILARNHAGVVNGERDKGLTFQVGSGHMYSGCFFPLLFVLMLRRWHDVCVCVHLYITGGGHGLVEECSVLAGRTCMSLGTLWGCQGRGTQHSV